jgi:hypothetical protein
MSEQSELDVKVDIIFLDGKIAADKSAMLIIKLKRITQISRLWFLPKTRLIRPGFWSMVLMNLQQNRLALKLLLIKCIVCCGQELFAMAIRSVI